MTIFRGGTESLIFVVERPDKDQNVGLEVLFRMGYIRFDVRPTVLAPQADIGFNIETRRRKMAKSLNICRRSLKLETQVYIGTVGDNQV